ncbi:hypothetical protein J6590_096664 [Homalodisca vitripennis]|nr:hypothetical protein J6590_096664 [Homalodisca vitripennis]
MHSKHNSKGAAGNVDHEVTGQQTTSRHVICSALVCLSDDTIAYTNLEISNWSSQRQVSRPPRDTSYAAPLSAFLMTPSLTQTWKYRTGVLSDRSADHLETRHIQRPCLPF